MSCNNCGNPYSKTKDCNCGYNEPDKDRILLEAKNDYENGYIDKEELKRIADDFTVDDISYQNFLQECNIES